MDKHCEIFNIGLEFRNEKIRVCMLRWLGRDTVSDHVEICKSLLLKTQVNQIVDVKRLKY